MDELRGFRVPVARGRPLAEEEATAACTIYGFNSARGRGGKRKERKRRHCRKEIKLQKVEIEIQIKVQVSDFEKGASIHSFLSFAKARAWV